MRVGGGGVHLCGWGVGGGGGRRDRVRHVMLN